MINGCDYDKYITTLENLASKNYIADFLKKTDFHDKLKDINKKLL